MKYMDNNPNLFPDLHKILSAEGKYHDISTLYKRFIAVLYFLLTFIFYLYIVMQRRNVAIGYIVSLKAVERGIFPVLEYCIEKDKSLLNTVFSGGIMLSTIAIQSGQTLCLALLDYKNFKYFNKDTNNSMHYCVVDRKKDTVAHNCIMVNSVVSLHRIY